MKKEQKNISKAILEILSGNGGVVKSDTIYYQLDTHSPSFRVTMRTLKEIGAVEKPIYGHYIITDLGQVILNGIRGSKA
jgi:Mn-dependent DtxR family transcriptional regulator